MSTANSVRSFRPGFYDSCANALVEISAAAQYDQRHKKIDPINGDFSFIRYEVREEGEIVPCRDFPRRDLTCQMVTRAIKLDQLRRSILVFNTLYPNNLDIKIRGPFSSKEVIGFSDGLVQALLITAAEMRKDGFPERTLNVIMPRGHCMLLDNVFSNPEKCKKSLFKAPELPKEREPLKQTNFHRPRNSYWDVRENQRHNQIKFNRYVVPPSVLNKK